MPNGSLESLGTDHQAAIEAANALNTALRASGCLVERILNKANNPQAIYDPRNPPMMQVIDEYQNNQLQEELERGKLSEETFKGKLLVLNEYNEAYGKIRCQEVTTFDLAQHL